MQNKILSRIFLDVYQNLPMFYSNKPKINIEDYDLLEATLENYLLEILGYKIKYNYEDNYREIIKLFENVFYNSRYKNYNNIIESINTYKKELKDKLENHKYTSLFIDTLRKMYSKSYDGRILTNTEKDLSFSTIAISNKGNSFMIGRIPRKEEQILPSIQINDIQEFEAILKKYIESVVLSDSFYNIFNNVYFTNISFEDKVKTLIECTLFNATGTDLSNIENFFRKYTDFINDKTFDFIRRPKHMGNLFNDDLYVMCKRSELEYETPYYLAFMLNNKRVELPNIRMGIENKEEKKVAHIIATQSAQTVLNQETFQEIQKEIKNNLPTDAYFRFYNPSHLVSILMTFGLLKGIGIEEVEVKDFLPFRYNKTVLDRQMDPEESDNFQRRLTNKNLITYMRLISVVDGIDIITYPEMDMSLKLKIEDNVVCKNEFLQKIYDMGYKLGIENKNNLEQNKTIK
ncbi:MAG: hypothetical protein IJE04_04120 [Bacilli bacterium]|nr:hypothetical protein [Bacilli bacterium]